MSPSTPNSTTIADRIVTVTQNLSTTTIFITTLVPPITPSSSPSLTTSGNPSTWKQKAVIVGSAVGGFVGFGLILGLLLWFLYFRRGEHKQTRGSADDHSATSQAERRKIYEENPLAATSVSAPAPHTSTTLQLDSDGGDIEPLRRDPKPSSSPHLPEVAASRTRPTRKRTITSDSGNGLHQIPVVVPSFAYRESTTSVSSGSRIVNALKRTGAVGATANSSSSRRRMSDVSVPYQYGVVGSADSRRGDLLGLESGATHLGPVRHDSVELEGWRAQAFYGPPSSPTLPVGAISGSGSGSGHSADSHLSPILAVAASSSYHEPDPPPSPIASSSVLRSHVGRQFRPSSPLDEHIMLSNYISPPSVPSSSSLPAAGKKSSWKTKGRRRSATVSDSGHGEHDASAGIGTHSASDRAPWSMQRSLSLDMTFLENTTTRARRGPDASPQKQSLLSIGPSQSTSMRQAPPPSSFPRAQLPSPPSPFVTSTSASHTPLVATPASDHVSTGDTSDEGGSDYNASASAEGRRRRTRRRSRSRSRSRSRDARRHRTFGREATPGEWINPRGSSFSAPRAGRRASGSNGGGGLGHSSSVHGHGYPVPGAGEYDEPQDEELVRLARTARRAERKIRRESRELPEWSDIGHGHGPQQQNPSQQHHRSGRRRSRSRPGSTRRYSDSGPDSPDSQRPRLVLRNV